VSSHEGGQNISQENEPRPKVYVRITSKGLEKIKKSKGLEKIKTKG
jgi:hypothetical protein